MRRKIHGTLTLSPRDAIKYVPRALDGYLRRTIITELIQGMSIVDATLLNSLDSVATRFTDQDIANVQEIVCDA